MMPMPAPGYINRDGFVLTREEFAERLRQRRRMIRRCCETGIAWVRATFPQEYDGPQIQDFADAIYDVLTLGLNEEIQYLETAPETPTGIGYPPVTVEQCADAEMEVTNWQNQIDEIEEVTSDPDLPSGMAAALGMGMPMLKSQLNAAIKRRDWYQKALESQEKKPEVQP